MAKTKEDEKIEETKTETKTKAKKTTKPKAKAKTETGISAKELEQLKKSLLKEMLEDPAILEVLEDKAVDNVSYEEVQPKDKVTVMSNVTHPISFDTANGRVISLRKFGQKKDVYVEDLEFIMSIAPALLKEGFIVLEDKNVIEHLDLTEFYENGAIVLNSELKAILKLQDKKLRDGLSNISHTAKKEVVKLASDMRDDLTIGQVKIIEEITGSLITEI